MTGKLLRKVVKIDEAKMDGDSGVVSSGQLSSQPLAQLKGIRQCRGVLFNLTPLINATDKQLINILHINRLEKVFYG